MRRIKPGDLLLRLLTWTAAAITGATVLFLIGYIVAKGVPNLRWSLFAWEYTTDNCSLTPALINTLTMTLLSLGIAVPTGVGAAVYMTEYARRGSYLVRAVRLTSETLTGIPSILYGLFGYLFFLVRLGWGYSMLSGGITLAIMILPIIMRTAEEALLAVPDGYREGSFGLGEGRFGTVAKILLPAAAPGILSGVILGVGRVVGETAALLFTAGTVAQVPDSLMGSGRTLSVHLYALSSEGLHVGEAYATALVLLVIVAGINALSAFAAKRVAGGASS